MPKGRPVGSIQRKQGRPRFSLAARTHSTIDGCWTRYQGRQSSTEERHAALEKLETYFLARGVLLEHVQWEYAHAGRHTEESEQVLYVLIRNEEHIHKKVRNQASRLGLSHKTVDSPPNIYIVKKTRAVA